MRYLIMNLLVLFIILNIMNVIIQTVTSLVTVKCGKGVAAINALAYGLYTIVVVYMMCDLPLLLKAFIIAMCNLIGVYIVKLIEEKSTRDKLWKVEMTVKPQYAKELMETLDTLRIPYSYIDIEKYILFNVYCETQKQSTVIKTIVEKYQAKYFVAECKTL